MHATQSIETRDSKYYKRRLLRYFASWSSNQFIGAVHEAPNLWSADVVACRYNGKLSEFEIKVSKSDLLGEIKAIRRALEPDSVTYTQQLLGITVPGLERAVVAETKLSETKIEKHHHYLVRPRKSFRPNQFYFAVPTHLVDTAVENLQGLKYGVMDADALTIVKAARSLHSDIHPNTTYINLFNRLSVMYRDIEDHDLALVHAVLEKVAEKYDLEYGSVGYLRLKEVAKHWEQIPPVELAAPPPPPKQTKEDE